MDTIDSEIAQFLPPKPRMEMRSLVWGEDDEPRRQQAQLERREEREKKEKKGMGEEKMEQVKDKTFSLK